MRLILLLPAAISLAACSTSQTVDAPASKVATSARTIVGNSLPGAIGATPADQRKIDRTVARGVAGGVYTRAEGQLHNAAKAAAQAQSAQR